jgi:signal peptidase II
VAVAAAVVSADQATKQWALDRLSRGPVHVIGPLDFELSRNTGSAFSLLQGQRVLLAVVALVVGVGLLAFAARSRRRSRAVEVGLIVGGAAGNLVDRLARGDHGAVVDFVALHFWPTFNLADSCIVVGCVLLGWTLLRHGAEA